MLYSMLKDISKEKSQQNNCFDLFIALFIIHIFVEDFTRQV
jgi:hypothetical protein